jgi:Cu/Ag efflux pump CusA
MWIVKIALDRPYTFIILALLILLLSPVIILRTPVDIFPNINIPVVAISWTYTGLNPEEFGLTRADRAVLNPSDSLVSGARVLIDSNAATEPTE